MDFYKIPPIFKSCQLVQITHRKAHCLVSCGTWMAHCLLCRGLRWHSDSPSGTVTGVLCFDT